MPSVPVAEIPEADVLHHHVRQLRALHRLRLWAARTGEPWVVGLPRPCRDRGTGATADTQAGGG
jgi:hypothetical protein